jgi:hypothetical protein
MPNNHDRAGIPNWRSRTEAIGVDIAKHPMINSRTRIKISNHLDSITIVKLSQKKRREIRIIVMNWREFLRNSLRRGEM